MKFYKYQALGNDFILVGEENGADYTKLAATLCDRKRGVGADGLLVFGLAPARLHVFNADGSSAEMCGNGLRCFLRFCAERKNVFPSEVKTRAGRIKTEVVQASPFLCVLDLGTPVFGDNPEIFATLENHSLGTISVTAVNTGVPHLVFLDEMPRSDAAPPMREKDFGSILTEEALNNLISVTNIDLASVNENGTFFITTFERGIGRTEACGTGAAAVFAAAHRRGVAGAAAEVVSAGGILKLKQIGDRIFLEGTAEFVFEGDIPV